jgi:hypothetical protein
MMDLMRNRANFALTDFVYKSRSIAQGQDSERKSSNFRLADHPGLIWRALGQIELRMPFVPFSFALVSMRQRQDG